MSLNELKDSSWAKTVFQISPVGDTPVCPVLLSKQLILLDLSVFTGKSPWNPRRGDLEKGSVHAGAAARSRPLEGRQLLRQHLDRHLAVEPGAGRPPYLAHAAFS